MARRETPEINAGSMADIAFLLLIFFLVTTTMNVDSGISRKLPEKPPADYQPPIIKEKNVLDITVNRNNQLLVEAKDYVKATDIKQIAIDFIDNGGGEGNNDAGKCDYCEGKRLETSSDHPNKAIISLQSDRGTSYAMYISIQNEIESAYTELRNRLATKMYGKSYTVLLKDYDLAKNAKQFKAADKLKLKIDKIKEMYPQIISEPDPSN